eukprot:m.136875 g.136875  ORF g.136875 m.136875 type:complete len:285 (+) comp11017_c0_seq1:54-908(+)
MSLRKEELYGDSTTMAVDMSSMINNSDFSDITFVIGDEREKIYAHKIILGARCEVFRAMFAEQKSQAKKAGEKKDVPLVLADLKPKVFKTILEFMYCNRCSLTQTTVVDTLAAAIEYGLDGLAECCGDYIKNYLNVDTACMAVQAAIAYDQPDLRDTCMTFIEDNTRAVLKSKHFVEISPETFAHILQSDHLQITEAELLNSVKEWGTVNSVVTAQSLKDTLKDVIGHIRFPLFSSTELQTIEDENEKTQIIPVKLIAKAWKYQATNRADPNDPHFKARSGSHG